MIGISEPLYDLFIPVPSPSIFQDIFNFIFLMIVAETSRGWWFFVSAWLSECIVRNKQAGMEYDDWEEAESIQDERLRD